MKKISSITIFLPNGSTMSHIIGNDNVKEISITITFIEVVFDNGSKAIYGRMLFVCNELMTSE